VSPSPGLTHIVENGSTGLHAQSLEDVLDAIARLATHAEFRQRLGANAARYVTGAHTMRDVRRFHKGLYEEMSGPQS